MMRFSLIVKATENKENLVVYPGYLSLLSEKVAFFKGKNE